MHDIPERDWRYLRSIQPEMLEELSGRILDEITSFIAAVGPTKAEKRRKLYDIVHQREKIVAECFDDWRRSRAYERCWALRKYDLLKAEHISQFTPESQAIIGRAG